MKKEILSILPFLCMFFLATGSVVISCATVPATTAAKRDEKISVNTGITPAGKIYTTWVFDRIQSVMIVDESDRSRKIELTRNEWNYDPSTTELSVLRAIPFKDYFANIEGSPSLPHTFVLNEIKDEADLMVIISDRLAIESYDYIFDAKASRLTFRNDANLKESDWSIHYTTPYGSAMLGDWKPENSDRMSYIEAEHRKRRLDSWYDKQTYFWFLDETRMGEWKSNPEQTPSLIRRAATPKELAEMKSEPVNVVKFRTDAKDPDLAREIGFNARVPEMLGDATTQGTFPLAWRTIEEHTRDGVLERKLDVVYEDGSGKGLSQYIIEITMELTAISMTEHQNTAWLIQEETMELGLPVHVIRRWGLQNSDISAKPTVIKFTTWTWTDGTVRYEANSDSENDSRTAVLLSQFIAARKRLK